MKTRTLCEGRSLIFAALACAVAAPGNAAVVVGNEEGWELSFDGNVNAFAIFEDGDTGPTNVQPSIVPLLNDDEAATIRTGLLPAVFAFNVKTPVVDGLQGGGRVGFFPQIQNAGTKNQFGAQIDLRQAFMTLDGDFGQLLAGRELSLFLGRNILTDMTLFGVGVQGGATSGGTTLGRIGYGYVYPQFNAQFRYTTPDISGFKLAVGAYNPSRIGNVTVGADGLFATDTDSPRFEAEASYVMELAGGSVEAWLNGMWQEAEFAPGDPLAGTTVTAQGIGAGAQWVMEPFSVLVSGYSGEGLGTTLMLDTDSLDSAGVERDNDGFIVQATYTFGGVTKFGVSYGESSQDETAADVAARLAGSAFLETQSSVTAGIYHDLRPWFKVVAEYTRAEHEWFDGQDQTSDLVTLGTFFTW